jgi:hypothetical protein
VISIGGNGSDGVCCASAPEMPSDTIGAKKLLASQKRRCRVAVMEDMVFRPRYDVSGTSQRTKSHHVLKAAQVKPMPVLPDRHLRV